MLCLKSVKLSLNSHFPFLLFQFCESGSHKKHLQNSQLAPHHFSPFWHYKGLGPTFLMMVSFSSPFWTRSGCNKNVSLLAKSGLTVEDGGLKLVAQSHRQFMRQAPNASCFTLLEEEQKNALCSTLSEILESACASPSTGFCLVTWAKGQSPHTDSQTQAQSQSQDVPEPASSQTPQEQQPSEFCIPHTSKLHAETLECSIHS